MNTSAAGGEVSVSFGSTSTGGALHQRRPVSPPLTSVDSRNYPGTPGSGPGGMGPGGMPFMSFDVGSTAGFAPPPRVNLGGSGYRSFDDEPPLLEELGINIPHITKKTLSILNPLKLNTDLHEDGDMSGPILLCIIFGLCQLLHQKVHFGVILGWGFLASLFLYTTFNLLVGGYTQNNGMDLYRTCSLVGYSLIPMILFSCGSFFGSGPIFKMVVAVLSIAWCVRTCTGLLVALAPHAEEHRWLLAYPCLLIYTAFSLLIVF